jgi:protein-L-isoaspartate O-methyltransferase
VNAAREFYHSFGILGLPTRQRSGIYPVNQRCKEQYILGYLLLALAKSRRSRASYRPSVLELFCADAYYAALAKRFGAGRVVAIDKDRAALDGARAVCDALGFDIYLRHGDVLRYRFRETYDVVLCTGGLYHLSNPCRFLQRLRPHVKRYLVAQSVVSLRSKDPDYFVAPAPGWQHGCRFSAAYFVRMLRSAGFCILSYGFNHLEGNRRAADRGAAYALCGVRPERWPG